MERFSEWTKRKRKDKGALGKPMENPTPA